jgi:tetratricopeptide (TPR) repeat protein
MHIVMKTVQFIFLLALVSAPAWGSNTKVDSLKQLLEQRSTADKAEVLWSIAYELFDVDNAQALFYADRAYHEVWKRGDSLQIVKVGTTYGQLLRRMGKVDRSIEISSRMLPIAQRHEYRKYWKMLLNSLGLAYAFRENFAKALEYHYRALAFAEESNDQSAVVLSLHNIGFMMYKLNDYDQSIDYSSRSLRLAEKIGESQIASTLLNIGSAHLGKGNYDSAKYYTSTALYRIRRNGSTDPTAQYLHQYATSYFELGKYDSAMHYSRMGINAAIREGNPWSLGFCYILLSRITLLKRQHSEARIFLDKAYGVSKGTDFHFLKLQILRQEGRYQAAIGNIDSALKTIDQYYHLNDSLYHGVEEAAVRRVQVEFDQRVNRRRIAMQTSVLEFQEEYLGQQRVLIFLITIFLVVVILLSLALYQAYRKKGLINQQLDNRVIERTKELSRNRDALQHMIDEENGRRGRATAEMMGLLSTLKGLLHLAKVDPDKRNEDYLDKALDLALQMEGLSQKYGDQTQRKSQVKAS